MKRRVYLDHNATTPLSTALQLRWTEMLTLTGNPSSIHQDSRIPKTWLRETRQKIAQYLQCSPLEIIFNSGASEGNSGVFRTIWEMTQIEKSERNEFIVSSVEHPCIMKAVAYLKTLGAVVHIIPVSKKGDLDLEYLKAKLSQKTALVSVMYANNETGVIFPVAEVSKLAHSVGALMHSDCVQTLGKVDLNFQELELDYATFSAHKFYALKGTGFVYVKKNRPWQPQIFGGGQERSRRGGTENIMGIASLGISFDILNQLSDKLVHMQILKNHLESEVLHKISEVTITAENANRLVNTSSFVIKDVDGETLLMNLDLKGYSVSTGAACSSGNPEPSPVLLAMGLTRLEAQSSMRVSLGWETTLDEVKNFVNTLIEVVEKLRKIKNEQLKTEIF